MSLHPRFVPDIPEETARIAQAAFRKGNPYMKMRDELGTFFTDDQFVDLYAVDGQPAFSPWRLALVCVMQFAENLTDRQAADAVRSRIDWKYALSLELEDGGFDYSVLCEFRQRLLTSVNSDRLFSQMLMRFQEVKLLKGRGKQRTDSTHVMAAIRLLNRLEMVGETLHHALNEIAVAEADWLKAWVAPIWFERYGRSFNEYRLPVADAERDQLTLIIGQDGLRLLQAIYEDPQTPPPLRELQAVETLRQVWLQQYYLDDDVLCWRDPQSLPPCAIRIQSPYDVEARYSSKRTTQWVGYKVHLTETCDDDAPHLITHVETTPGTTQDVEVVETIHATLAQHACLPAQHITDTGYSAASIFVDSQTIYGVDFIAPVRPEHSWQFTEKTGFDAAQFQIDWERKKVTCPMGKESASWTPCPPRRGHAIFYILFRERDCRTCLAKAACTRGKRRSISVQERELVEMVAVKRSFQQTDAYQDLYRLRAGVEGTISQATWALGMRRSRYWGLEKTHLQNVFTAAAINLTRAVNWLFEKPLSHTRRSRFAALVA
mgnify:CR=1 FL=1